MQPRRGCHVRVGVTPRSAASCLRRQRGAMQVEPLRGYGAHRRHAGDGGVMARTGGTRAMRGYGAYRRHAGDGGVMAHMGGIYLCELLLKQNKLIIFSARVPQNSLREHCVLCARLKNTPREPKAEPMGCGKTGAVWRPFGIGSVCVLLSYMVSSRDNWLSPDYIPSSNILYHTHRIRP